MPDPNRPLSRMPRELSRFGRTPMQKALLLVSGSVVAFLLGRWTGADNSFAPRGNGGPAPRGAKEMPATISGTPMVLDGDTLDFDGLRVRIFGIDAFEKDQLCESSDGARYGCGQFSRQSMLSAIDGSVVTCARRDVDKYGRMVAVCRGRSGDLAERVVKDGYALAYRHYSSDYIDEEDDAHRARRGAWQGRFEAPWDYRHNGAGKEVR